VRAPGTARSERPTGPRALVVQHVAAEPPGLIAAALQAESVDLEVVRADRGEEVPVEAGGWSAVVVMGGPMSVADAARLDHLRRELALLESALARDVPVLGVCLGSQLLAHVLGARVAPAGFLELGWLPVSLTPGAARDPLLGGCPPRFTALHWHGEAFELPRGATHLARSDRTAVQGFSHGRAWGLLFHLEADVAQVEEMARAFGDEVARGGSSAAALVECARREVPGARRVGLEVLGRFARLASARAPAR
jgi:GMP synthase (glutamine-hydrolysing)